VPNQGHFAAPGCRRWLRQPQRDHRIRPLALVWARFRALHRASLERSAGPASLRRHRTSLL